MDDKRRQWELIKAQASDAAELLTAINRRFGPCSAVRVESKSGDIIETGRFKAVHPRLVLGQIRE